MIISHRHRYIFVHIPKTGGTSLTLALEARVGRDDIILSDTPKGKNRRRRLRDVTARGRLWKHATLADIEGLVDPAIFSDYLLVTMVRNPWARAVSYHRWLRRQRFANPAVDLAQHLDFREFLQQPLIRRQMAVPARHYLTDSQGCEHPALFLRLEHLDQDLPALRRHLGFDPGHLPHVNRSADSATDTPWRDAYDETTAALVSRAAAEDISRFGYDFSPPRPDNH